MKTKGVPRKLHVAHHDAIKVDDADKSEEEDDFYFPQYLDHDDQSHGTSPQDHRKDSTDTTCLRTVSQNINSKRFCEDSRSQDDTSRSQTDTSRSKYYIPRSPFDISVLQQDCHSSYSHFTGSQNDNLRSQCQSSNRSDSPCDNLVLRHDTSKLEISALSSNMDSGSRESLITHRDSNIDFHVYVDHKKENKTTKPEKSSTSSKIVIEGSSPCHPALQCDKVAISEKHVPAQDQTLSESNKCLTSSESYKHEPNSLHHDLNKNDNDEMHNNLVCVDQKGHQSSLTDHETSQRISSLSLSVVETSEKMINNCQKLFPDQKYSNTEPENSDSEEASRILDKALKTIKLDLPFEKKSTSAETSNKEQDETKTILPKKEKRYKCGICKHEFLKSHHLKIHMYIHAGTRPYRCDVCEKGFNQSSNLQRHKRIHTGDIPYKCTLCDKGFNQVSGLTIHLRMHSGEKPYHCEVCNKGFSDRSNLRRHMGVHTGENRAQDKRYPCDVCARLFTDRSNLRRHMHIHTGTSRRRSKSKKKLELLCGSV